MKESYWIGYVLLFHNVNISNIIYMPKMIFHSFIYQLVLYPGFLAMEQIDLGAVVF
jgi:hypothetical protein